MIARLRLWWERLHRTALGRFVFSRILGFLIPYSGSIKPLILEARTGYAKIEIKQRRSILNHLDSIHALALANLGELTSGMAIHFSMGFDERAILIGLKTSYLKKARGVITAIAQMDIKEPLAMKEYVMKAHLYDEKGDEVAIVETHWLLGKKLAS